MNIIFIFYFCSVLITCSKCFSTYRGLFSSQRPQKNQTALILFEDIDLTFEDDDGFYAAVNSLIASTKRPILLTTSNAAFFDLQMASAAKGKVLKISPVAFHFDPVPPHEAVTHLKLLALVEGYPLASAGLEELLKAVHGNISKALLALQCFCIAGLKTVDRPETSVDLRLTPADSTTSVSAAEDGMKKATEVVDQEKNAIVKLMGVNSREHMTTAQLLGLSEADVSSYLLNNNTNGLHQPQDQHPGLLEATEWHQRFHHLTTKLFAQKRPKVGNIPTSSISPAVSEAVKKEVAPEERRPLTPKLLGPKEIVARESMENRTRLSSEEKAAMKFLTEAMEAASDHVNVDSHDLNTSLDQLMAFMHPTIQASSEKIDQSTNDLKAFKGQIDMEGIKQRVQTLHLAHQEALEAASTKEVSTSLAASADVLPVLRAMIKAEEGRRITLKNGETKRSRSSRFIHYFDTVNIYLSETHLAALRRPFDIFNSYV